jgi:hypothetical protein
MASSAVQTLAGRPASTTNQPSTVSRVPSSYIPDLLRGKNEERALFLQMRRRRRDNKGRPAAGARLHQVFSLLLTNTPVEGTAGLPDLVLPFA